MPTVVMSEDVEETKSRSSHPRGLLGIFATMPTAVRPWLAVMGKYV